jgi:hypothetical protein
LLLLGIPAFDQYPEIVTTDDGQQVYFKTLLVERSAPTARRPIHLSDNTTEKQVVRPGGRPSASTKD